MIFYLIIQFLFILFIQLLNHIIMLNKLFKALISHF